MLEVVENIMNDILKGTINIPVDMLQNKLDELGDAKIIVTACYKGGGRSTKAAQLLKENGKMPIGFVAVLSGGLKINDNP